MAEGRAVRISTAGEGTGFRPIINRLVAELPQGLVLNLGAGNTRAASPRHTIVNLDHVRAWDEREPALNVVGDALYLPFAAGSFVGVVAKDVLEHVQSPIEVLSELHRICRPGARLVVTVPRAIPRAVWDDPTHLRGFTRRALTTALTLGGWTVDGSIGRIGSIPGARRLRVDGRLETIMRVPGVGHWWGRNWIARATRQAEAPGDQ